MQPCAPLAPTSQSVCYKLAFRSVCPPAWQRYAASSSGTGPRHGAVTAANPDKAPADALTETLGGISSKEGRVSNATNVILGADNSLEKWKELDQKVNEYPSLRSFKAIGSGGQDFVESMIAAVTSIGIEVLPKHVHQRPSSNSRYISVTIGPVIVTDREQVIEVYSNMRGDSRLKYFL